MRGREPKLKIDIYSKPQLKYKNPVEGTRTNLHGSTTYSLIIEIREPRGGDENSIFYIHLLFLCVIEIREPRGGDENCVEDGFFRNDGIIEIREPRGGDENSA